MTHTTAPATPADTVLIRADDNPVARCILNAAVTMIGERGYHGTSVRDIAAAAQVSPGTLYNYFGAKQSLLATLMCRAMEVLIEHSERALQALPAGADAPTRLSALVDAHVRVHAMAARESLIGNSELRSLEGAPLRAVIHRRDRQQHLFDETVAEGVRSGAFVVNDSKVAARYVVTACTAVATWYRPEGPLTVDALVAHYQALARRTLGCADTMALPDGDADE